MAPCSAWLEDHERDLPLGALLVGGVAAVGLGPHEPQPRALLGVGHAGVHVATAGPDLDGRVGVGAQVVKPGGR